MARLRDILAARILAERRNKGWTQEELAANAGLSERYLGKVERRQVAASIDVVERIASALAVDPSSLLSKLRRGQR